MLKMDGEMDPIVEYEKLRDSNLNTSVLESALYHECLRLQKLIELYAQEQAGTDDMLDGIREQQELWSGGRQARDTWD